MRSNRASKVQLKIQPELVVGMFSYFYVNLVIILDTYKYCKYYV